jgi:serine/threonine protein kinase
MGNKMDAIVNKHKLQLSFKTNVSDVYVGEDVILKKFKPIAARGMYTVECHYLVVLKDTPALTHHIPNLLDRNDKEMYFVLDNRGLDGTELINANKFTKECWWDYVIQLSAVVNAIVGAGFVHRDIKPENAVYDTETRVWTVIDFAFMEPKCDSNVTRVRGTFPYVAPFLGDDCMMQMFLTHNKKKQLKPCNDYFAFALSALSLMGVANYEQNIQPKVVYMDLEPFYKLWECPKTAPIVKALTKIVLSCLNTGYASLHWTIVAGRMVCGFTGPRVSYDIERDVVKCWNELIDIIENHKRKTEHVPPKGKYKQSKRPPKGTGTRSFVLRIGRGPKGHRGSDHEGAISSKT